MSCQNSAYEASEDLTTLSKPLRRLKSASILSKARTLRSYRQSEISDFGQKRGNGGMTVLIQEALTNRKDKDGPFSHFRELLQQILQRRAQIQMFCDYRDLLKYKYHPRHTYCIIINQQLREDCQSFVANELTSGTTFALHLICICSTQIKYEQASKKQSIRSKDSRHLHLYCSEDDQYPTVIAQLLSELSSNLEKTAQRCILSNFTSQRKEEDSPVYFVCEEIIAKMLMNYRSKSRKSIKIDQFKTFDDILLIARQEKVSYLRELKQSYYYTSMKDVCSELQTQTDQQSYLVHSDHSLNKSFAARRMKPSTKDAIETKAKVIICRRFHKDIKKVRAFVNTEKNKWNLWEISDEASGIMTKLKEFFGEEEIIQDCLELQSYRSCNFQRVQDCTSQKVDNRTFQKVDKIASLKIDNRTFEKAQQNMHKQAQKQQKQFLAEAISISIDKIDPVLKQIDCFGSKPILPVNIAFNQEFKHLQPPVEKKFIPVGFLHSTIDKKVPSLLSSILFLQETSEPKPLSREILNEIKNNTRKKMVLSVNLDEKVPAFCSATGCFDEFVAFQPLQIPKVVLSPNTIQLKQIKTTEETIPVNVQPIEVKQSQREQPSVGPKDKLQEDLVGKNDSRSEVAEQQKQKVFLQKHLYMKQFKHLSKQSRSESSPFCDSPEIYYQSELGLASKLKSEAGSCVVLYSEMNEKWIANLKGKSSSSVRWFCLEDQNWIDEEGNLNYETNVVKLSSKIKLFGSLLGIHYLDLYQGVQFFQLVLDEKGRSAYSRLHKNVSPLEEKSQKEIIDYYLAERQRMVVIFVLGSDESPKLLLDLEREGKGRIRLIFVRTAYVQSREKLFIRYSEIHAVIKNLWKMENSQRKNFIIYNSTCGRSQLQALLQERQLQNAEEKQYSSVWPDVQKIFSLIKGLYRKIYIICYEDQQKDIQRLFSTYNIQHYQSQEIIAFSLLKRDRSQNSSSIKSIDHLSSNPITSDRQSSLQFEATPTLGIKDDEEGRGSLPIESRDHEQAPSKEIERMVRVDDYSKILIVYQQMLNPEEKRGLLAACTKCQKIIPVLYQSVSELKAMQSQQNLILLLMKQIPMQLFNELIEKEQMSIIFKNCNLKAVLPKYTDINLNSIIDLFEHSYTPSIRKLESEQISQYLTKFETETSQKHPSGKEQSQLPSSSVTTNKNDSSKHEQENPSRNEHCSPSSNLSQKTNLTSICREVKAYEQQLSKLRKAINKNLLVLLVDFHKRNKYTIMAVKHHLIIQSFSGEANLQTEIRKKIGRHVVLCVIETQLLPKAIALKKKYSNVFFFLQHGKYSWDPDEQQKSCLAGEFGKSAEFQRFLGEAHKQEVKQAQVNPEAKQALNADLSLKMLKQGKRTSFQCTSMGKMQGKGEKSRLELSSGGESRLSNNTLNKVKGSKIRSPLAKKQVPFEHSQYYQQ